MDSKGEGRAGGKRKNRDLGRAQWRYIHIFPGKLHVFHSHSINQASRQMPDKRARNQEQEEIKRRKLEQGEEIEKPIYATHFLQEDIDQEERRPKKKVAVLLSYSGTGYHGMQL